MNPPERPPVAVSTTAVANRSAENSLDPMVLLRSLRRRWLPCVLLGVPLAAVLGTAAHFLIPAPYVATSEIHFKSYSDHLVFETREQQAQFRTRKQTHQRLVTSRQVLTAALRKIDVPQTALLNKAADPVEQLAQSLVVKSTGEEFFTVALSGEDPQEVADVVNAVTDAYMSDVVLAEQEDRRTRLADLQKVAARVQEELQLKREELRKFSAATDGSTTVMFDQKQAFLLNMQVEIRKQIAQIELELIRLRVRDRVKAEIGKDDLFPAVPDSVVQTLLTQEPDYKAAETRVEQYRRLVERAERELSPTHPSTVKARSDLAAAESRRDELAEKLRPEVLRRLQEIREAEAGPTGDELADHVASLEATKGQLERELESMKVGQRETGIYSLELDTLTKELGRLEALSDTLAGELDQREFEQKNARLPATILQKAVPPVTRSFKKRLLGTVGGAGAGLGVVMLGIALLDFRAGRISTRSEIADKLSMRLIGMVPALPSAAMQGGGSRRRRRQTVYWTSALKESIDAARTMLQSLAAEEQIKVILVSSAIPAEGKTTLSLHLATSLARAGRRVALIDADLRRPSLSRIYDLPDFGLCEVIRGEATLDEVLQPGNVPGLQVLAAGILDETVLGRVADDGLAPIMASLKRDSDFVIIDSPPVLPLCDALLVARHVDGVLFAIRRDVSRRPMIAAALERFRSLRVPVLGAVAIGLHEDPAGYNEMYYYRRNYEHGYASSQA